MKEAWEGGNAQQRPGMAWPSAFLCPMRPSGHGIVSEAFGCRVQSSTGDQPHEGQTVRLAVSDLQCIATPPQDMINKLW